MSNDSNEVTEEGNEQAVKIRKRTSQHPSNKSKKNIRAWVRGDLISLEDRDHGWEYRWCDKNNDVKMAQRLAQGYVLVTSTSGLHAQNAGQADIKHSGPSTSGIVAMGDLVLMALPEELADERRQAVTELNKEALTGMTEELDSNMSRIGAPVTGEGVKIDKKVKLEV